MTLLERIKTEIAGQVNRALKKKDGISAGDLAFPPNPEMGDLSLPCFGLSKSTKQSPAETAAFLVGKVKTGGLVSGVRAVGPYLNFSLDKGKLAAELLKQIHKEAAHFGTNKTGKKQGVMIEYSNANTHKEYHIGHLRNIAYGDAVNRLLAANGFAAVPVSYINDFGIHVAKTLWWVYHPENGFAQDLFNAKGGEAFDQIEDKGNFLGSMYAEATSQMASRGEAAKAEVGAIMKEIESRHGKYYELWQQTRGWSIDLFARIYQELGVSFKDIFYESEFIDQGIKKVAELYEQRFLVRSQGAVIADLEAYGLGVLMVLRSDGTALYPVADLPLAMAKFDKYKLKKSIYVVDIRQGLYFKQLFKVLELMGYKQELVHLGYDFVKLPEGMMASRSGNVITYDRLKHQMTSNASQSTREKHPDWTDEQVEAVARKIAFGAMKFEMIKVGRDKTITFEFDKAMRFDGFTSAYLQYAYARIESIKRKACLPDRQAQSLPTGQASAKPAYRTGKRKAKTALELSHPKEQELVMKLAKYPAAVEQAGQLYEPSEIAKYLFELAQQLNDYYHEVPVLKAEDEAVKNSRLALLEAVQQVLANGLQLLGIETIEEM